jgi:hypothetical protein
MSLQGVCAGCGRGIPHGFLATVTKWDSVNVAAPGVAPLPVQKPRELYCRACPASKELAVSTGSGRVHKQAYYKPDEMEPKEIAIRILKVASRTRPRGARRLATKAEIQFSPIVAKIIEKLEQAGKLVKAVGMSKWTKP